MDSPQDRAERELKSARRLNESLAKRVRRWKRSRLAAAAVLLGAGLALAWLKTAALLFAVPCFLGAFIAFLLYLDSRDQLREVESREWVSPTPKISNLGQRRAATPSDAPASQ